LSVVDWSLQVICLPEITHTLGKISLTQEQFSAFEYLIAYEENHTKYS